MTARGEEVDLRVMEIAAPPKPMKPKEIRKVRESLHASQTAFAHFLCVSPKAVQSWEQGIRRLQSTALRLLDIAKKESQVVVFRCAAFSSRVNRGEIRLVGWPCQSAPTL